MDRLDEIWKDRFNSEELPINDRTVPDDLVWENIAEATVRKDKRKKLLWWILAGIGLTVLILTVTALGANEQLTKRSNSQITKSIVPPEKKSNQVLTSNEPKRLTSQLGKNMIKKEKLSKKGNTNPILSKRKTNKGEEGLAFSIIDKTRNYGGADTYKSPKSSSIVQTSSFAPSTYKKQTVSKINNQHVAQPTLTQEIQDVSVLPSKFPLLISTDQQLPTSHKIDDLPIIKSIEPIELNHPQSKWTISSGVGISYWQHKMSRQYTGDLAAFDFNYRDKVGILGFINIKRQLFLKCFIEAGLNYERVSINSGHNANLTYNMNNELSGANDYALSVATPYGPIPTSFKLAREDNASLDDETELLVDFHARHTIHNFSIPLMIKYAPITQIMLDDKLRFSPNLGIGLGVNYLSKIANKFDNINTNHTLIRFDNTDYSFDQPNINQWHFDCRLSIGTKLDWNKSWSLAIEYQRIAGINNLFQLENYKTKINRHYLLLSVGKRF